MANEKNDKQSKIIIEREYIVPLRREWLKVPDYRRATKAVKALKQFIAQHMKIYDRDLKKVKVDVYLNNEIRFRGMRKPPKSIKVRAIKYETGEVVVKLVNIPKHIEFEMAGKVRKLADKIKAESETKKKPEEKPAETEEKEEATEEKQEEKEKETSSKIATEQIEKAQAKQLQHTSKTSQETPRIQRKSLRK